MKFLGYLLVVMAFVFAVVVGMTDNQAAGCHGGGGRPPRPPPPSTTMATTTTAATSKFIFMAIIYAYEEIWYGD
ncbi:hypothetical protein HF086_002013 [Spodoptera exigua]|uniref:Uncharacterized protein n=1 Tax=Spodoptera exigua TaxID=7107 RepID=A0A922MLP2_SPOEX|nr:hypothetical protein HF086_002013 [Spodoptera exigua]